MLIVSFLVLATLVSSPFIAAVIIAFLLQGLVNNLQKIGIPKLTSVLTTYLFFVFYINAVIIIPIIGRQTSLLLRERPTMSAT